MTVTSVPNPEQLSPKERARFAYDLRVKYGHTYAEIARVLGYASKAGAFNAVTRVKRSVNPIHL
jgi:uncharacterized protein YegP (UPF0339 family)